MCVHKIVTYKYTYYVLYRYFFFFIVDTTRERNARTLEVYTGGGFLFLFLVLT